MANVAKSTEEGGSEHMSQFVQLYAIVHIQTGYTLKNKVCIAHQNCVGVLHTTWCDSHLVCYTHHIF